MKIMSRSFTLAEKVLIAVLALILLGLVYYRFVDQVVRETISNNEAEAQMLQTQMDAIQARLVRLNSVKKEMDKLNEGGNLSYLASYNNSKEEVAFLNDILADTLKYSISFANVTRNGDLIRRSFTLQYTCGSYKAAQDIIMKLCTGKNRCLVGDMQCKMDTKTLNVTLSASATFYETMVGGTPDAGLPVTKGTANR